MAQKKSVRFQGYQYEVVDVEVDGQKYVAWGNHGAGWYHSVGDAVDEDGQRHHLLTYCGSCNRGDDCMDADYGDDIIIRLKQNHFVD